jgi:hypothetical protein
MLIAVRPSAASILVATSLVLATTACQAPEPAPSADKPAAAEAEGDALAEADMGRYATVRLDVDLSGLSAAERAMVPLLIEAAEAMDTVYWQQAYGDPVSFLASITDLDVRRYAEVNYGPWDRLEGDAPFLAGVGAKPLGAGFYPQDVTKEEILEATNADDLRGLYSLVRRNADGGLEAVPFHVAFAAAHRLAADRLRAAADLAEQPGLEAYLRSRAKALETDDYRASDLAWMDMRDNTLDIVIGPIETYEDQLLGAKAAHEAYVVLKDLDWSKRLLRYAEMLPDLQRGLPVAARYKAETPGTDSDLGAYDVLFVAGHGNAGSKAIAFNLPNDEQVQLEKGTRRVQMKNAMRAKFDTILLPIAGELIDPDQRQHVTFDAFFANTMFHEVAHGLGIKNTIPASGTASGTGSGSGTVRAALQNHASAIEEGKADILGLYMVTALADRGELGEVDLMDNYTTFLASIFRSIRFGSSSAHGVANLLRFNYFAERGAFSRDADGFYRVEADQMAAAVDALSAAILTLQGDGDYQAVDAFVTKYGVQGENLERDIDRLAEVGIPVDIVFEQGLDVLGLAP